jgi:hypothetical protein
VNNKWSADWHAQEGGVRLALPNFLSHAVPHLDERKGWMFWFFSTDSLVCSVCANFEDIQGASVIKMEQQNFKPRTLLKTYPSRNLVSLGDFSHDIAFE